MKRAFHRIGHGGLPSRKRGNMRKGCVLLNTARFVEIRRSVTHCRAMTNKVKFLKIYNEKVIFGINLIVQIRIKKKIDCLILKFEEIKNFNQGDRLSQYLISFS